MSASLTKVKVFFPSIFRFITEHSKILVVGLTSVIVLLGIVIQGLRLQVTHQQLAAVDQQKLQMSKELQYWQDVARQYSNYRDVYFRIASLQYELGDSDEAEKSLEKVFALDPNFEEGNVLGAKIEAKK